MESVFDAIASFFKEINWALSLLGAVILSIIANLLTPIIQNKLAGRSTRRARRRLRELEADLSKVSLFALNRQQFYLHLAHRGFLTLVLIGLGGAMASIIPIFSGFVGSIFYLMAVGNAMESSRLISKVSRFDEYKASIESQINEFKSLAQKK